jgi:hypothetical protein
MSDDKLDQKTVELLTKLSGSRDKLEVYTGELEGLKDQVLNMFPKDINFRSKWILDEKVKITSEFYSSLLRLRVEINKTLKDEITLRANNKEGDKKSFNETDVREMSNALDELDADKKEVKKVKVTKPTTEILDLINDLDKIEAIPEKKDSDKKNK